MKDDNITAIRVCPQCGKAYTGVPALSRLDNESLVCPDCGTRQALATLGISSEEVEKILSIIHRHQGCTHLS